MHEHPCALTAALLLAVTAPCFVLTDVAFVDRLAGSVFGCGFIYVVPGLLVLGRPTDACDRGLAAAAVGGGGLLALLGSAVAISGEVRGAPRGRKLGPSGELRALKCVRESWCRGLGLPDP